MCIDFRRAHAGVAEHLLYGKQVGTAFQKMGGEAVPEGVRTDGLGYAILFGEFFHDEEDHLSGEACATAVEENGVGEFGFGCDMQSRTFYILEEDF